MLADTPTPPAPPPTARTLAVGFLAGTVGTVLFHQTALAVLHAVGFAPWPAYPMGLTRPFGVPQLWSLAFWGGLWGIPLAILLGRAGDRRSYWLRALVFGALAPTLVAWLVVAPLKSQPIAGGGKLAVLVTGLVVNAAWGLGAALVLWLGARPPHLARRSVVATGGSATA